MTKCSDTSIQASARIAKFLSHTLNLPLVDTEDKLAKVMEDVFIDTIILVNSPSAFCTWLDDLAGAVNECKNFVYVMNDYTLYTPTQLRTALFEREAKGDLPRLFTWANIPKMPPNFASRKTYRHMLLPPIDYVDLNMVTFSEMAEAKRPRPDPVPGLFYYGAFRQDRVQYFKRYFSSDLYPTLLSTTSDGAVLKFRDAGCNFTAVPKFLSLSEIASYQASIYIEDEFTHSTYNSPANRFYECLSAGVPLFFDRSAVGTFQTAGYNVDRYTVASAADVAKLLPMSEEIRQEQQAWKKDFTSILAARVRELWTGVTGKEKL
jgi:hypothetical protein